MNARVIQRAASGGSLVSAAIELLRSRGIGATVRYGQAYFNARFQLRRASSLGRARLVGKVRVSNAGTLVIEDRVRLDGTTVRIDLATFEGGKLVIGAGTFINYGTSISAVESVSIGRDCAIGQYSIIMDCDHHDVSDLNSRGPVEPIVIEDNVWIGARSIILRGSHVGRGAVIGANSIVKGYIPPDSLAVGSPARVVREIVRPD